MVVNHAARHVPGVEPQLQAGILTHATRAVAASAAFGRSRFGHTQSWIVDPRFIIQEMVSRDILSKALKLAERSHQMSQSLRPLGFDWTVRAGI